MLFAHLSLVGWVGVFRDSCYKLQAGTALPVVTTSAPNARQFELGKLLDRRLGLSTSFYQAQTAHALQATPSMVGKKRKDPTILRSKPGSSKRIRADQQALPANGKAAKPPAKPPAKPSKGGRAGLGVLERLPVLDVNCVDCFRTW